MAAFESPDTGISNIREALFDSLPWMARADALVKSGQRAPNLLLSTDIAKTVGVQGTIIGLLNGLGGLRQAWMYSMNSHPPGEGSGPFLVLIVGRVDLMELNEAVTRLEGKLGREINYTVFDEAEFQRRRAEADPFLTEVFGGRNVQLIEREDAA
jgi:hypothetical protein